MIRIASNLILGFMLALGLTISFVGSLDARRLDFIRDAEIEHSIRSLAAPLFAVAGIDEAAVRVHIVNDSRINAFVAGGQNIFVFTGLIVEADHPGQISGVLAHEIAHIAAADLARAQDALRNSNAHAILAAVLGAAVIIGGQSQAGAAVISSGQTAAQQSLLKYSRTQESVADQAAFTYLEQTGQSSRGLLEILEKLSDKEAAHLRSHDLYTRSHPLSRQRITDLRRRITTSNFANEPFSPASLEALARGKAKILAFLGKPAATFRRYPRDDDSLSAHYARAIAYHRISNLTEALEEVNLLISRVPDDPYFHELKGQIYYENGHVEDSLAPLDRAVKLAPHEPLLRLALARALIASETNTHYQRAIEHLIIALKSEPDNSDAWHQLAVAYGRNDQFGHSALANAEWSLLTGRSRQAKRQARQAQDLLPRGSPGWLRAEDIQILAGKP